MMRIAHSPTTSLRGSTPVDLLDGSAIQHLEFFRDCATPERDHIAHAAKVERVEKGGSIFRQGDAPCAVYMVLNGRFKAVRATAAGYEVVMRLAGPGDLIGHVSVLANAPYPATPVAVIDSLVLRWSPRDFIDLLRQHASLSLAVMRNMGKFLEEAHTRLHEAATERVERRIAHAVLRLARQAGHRVEGGVEIAFPITRRDIALMTGAALHTVSRTLSAWEQQGILEGGRQRLIIRDPNALLRIAEEI